MRIERQKEVNFYLTNFFVSLAVKIIGKWKMKFLTPSTQNFNEQLYEKKHLKIFQLKLYLFMRNEFRRHSQNTKIGKSDESLRRQ